MTHFELTKDNNTLHIVSIDLGRMPWPKAITSLAYFDDLFAKKGVQAVCVRSYNGTSVSCIALGNADKIMPVIELPVGATAPSQTREYMATIRANLAKFGIKDAMLMALPDGGGSSVPDELPTEESNLVKFAKSEFAILGWDKKDDEGGDTMQTMICADILEMIEVFSKQGHSGHSASYAIGMLERLLRFKPLSPLTGKDDEWTEVGMNKETGSKVFQNKRDSEVFMEDDGAYWAFGRVFEEENGSRYTNRDSRVPIQFPWTHPKSPEVVKRASPVEDEATFYKTVTEKPTVEVKDNEECCACQEEPECGCGCDADVRDGTPD